MLSSADTNSQVFLKIIKMGVMQMGLASKVELKIREAGEPEKLRFPRDGGDPLETGGGTGPREATRPELLPPMWYRACAW